jgi:hypothetical protein
VVQRCERTGFPAEAGQTLGISRELGRQGLDGDVAAEFAVVGAVHLAHTSCPELRDDAVRSALPARRQSRNRCVTRDRRLEEATGFFFLCQQQIDLTPQVGIFGAGIVEERPTVFGVAFQSRVQENLHSPQTFLIHND